MSLSIVRNMHLSKCLVSACNLGKLAHEDVTRQEIFVLFSCRYSLRIAFLSVKAITKIFRTLISLLPVSNENRTKCLQYSLIIADAAMRLGSNVSQEVSYLENTEMKIPSAVLSHFLLTFSPRHRH